MAEDDAWFELELERLRAERGSFDRGLMAGIGDDMLADAMKAVEAAEEIRLLRELTGVASDWAFPPWSESYDPRIDDRDGEGN